MVGTVTGVSFAVTSVFSGLVLGNFGMGWALYGSVALTVVCLLHLQTIHIEEPEPERTEGEVVPKVDVRGALDAIHAVPGLGLLIALAAFNNLLMGVFMALMDAYGLELVSVETWGFLWGFISLAFIVGGIVVARRGLGPRPLRLIIVANLVNWTLCATFTLRSSIVPLVLAMFVYLALIPVIEAAEQTVLQRSIPFERQGRVFGFAQLVENAAAPVTAFMIGPFAETFAMPFMTDGRGADAIGDWFGTGPDRGMALMFTVAGLIGIVVTLLVSGQPVLPRAERRAGGQRRRGRRAADAWPCTLTLDSGTLGQAAVDLGAHDPAVRGGVVVAAQQGAAQVVAGALEPLDLVVERRRGAAEAIAFHSATASAPRTPAMSSSDRPASCSIPMNTSRRSVSVAVAALAGLPVVGLRAALPLVVADRRGRHAGPARHLADRERRVVHATT